MFCVVVRIHRLGFGPWALLSDNNVIQYIHVVCYFEQHDSSPQTFCCCDFGPSTLRTNALQLERPQETLPKPPAVVDVGKVARAAQLSTS
jgi:hypothetical protein